MFPDVPEMGRVTSIGSVSGVQLDTLVVTVYVPTRCAVPDTD
jgi:hypothetical protein